MATIVSTRSSARAKFPSASQPDFPTATPEVVEQDLGTKEEIQRALHLLRPDGSRCFSEQSGAAKHQRHWMSLRTAVRRSGESELSALLRRAERRDGRPAALQTRTTGPAPSFHSEALRTSVLRTDWSSGAAQLAVDWSGPNLRCDLTVGRDGLLSGVMPVQAMLDGRRLHPLGSWEEVCWESDDDADYLELELMLGHEARLQRQFLLTRTDGLLFIADALICPTPADLKLELALPPAKKASFSPSDETREGRLTTGRRSRLVVPAALPEWRCDQHGGELLDVGGTLTLRQSAHQALALYAPLCLVVDPRRAARPTTWRRLTIAEDLRIQPNDRAVGYRLQVGREQWLFYRSLTPRANRSVLGVNLQTNFLCARFLRNGEVERLMEIED